MSAYVMVNTAGSFGKDMCIAPRIQRSFMGLLAMMWMVGCAVISRIPDLDTPDGRVYAHECGNCHGTPHNGGHGVPDPRFRTMEEWHEVLPKMDRMIRERGLPPLTKPKREAIIR
jgi:hypothetical protein